MSETMATTTNKIVWFEIPAEDTKRAAGFYGKLFDWAFEPYEASPEYLMASEAGGAVKARMNGVRGPVVYFGVDDIDAAIARVRELGGRAGEREEIPNVGSYAECLDTEGNEFSLFQQG